MPKVAPDFVQAVYVLAGADDGHTGLWLPLNDVTCYWRSYQPGNGWLLFKFVMLA
jgi:hypothetical protein